jgi:hypothetical protein
MREIPLTQGFVALVDDEDFLPLSAHRWFAWHSGNAVYARRNLPGSGRGGELMHRAILGDSPGLEIDHVSHHLNDVRIVDNRRANLRFVTHAQNCAGFRGFRVPGRTSVFKGVSLHRESRLWRATISPAGTHRNLGYFKTEVYAAYTYDLAAVATWGAHALTNFPVPGSHRWIYG